MNRTIITCMVGLMMWGSVGLMCGAADMGTAFTYQGRLSDTGSPAEGEYDFKFELYDDPCAALGNPVGSTVNIENEQVSNGLFTVELDFGSGVFEGDARWLEIGVRPGDDTGAYTTLSPQQEVTPNPYALYAGISGTDNDWMVSGNDMYSIPSGNVGIGTTSPGEKLVVDGIVHSTSGGIKFPDGTVQTSAAAAATKNPLQIAQLRWYEANQTGHILPPVGDGPSRVAFDGVYIWVTLANDDRVTKLRASDGCPLNTYTVGDGPGGVVCDGIYIWVANRGDDTVTKIFPWIDAGVVGTYAVGDGPGGMAFDGTHIWVVNYYDDTVTKLRASDGGLVGTYAVGDSPVGVAFDGIHIWVVNSLADTITKLRASDGGLVGTYPTGHAPYNPVFDGSHIWVPNNLDATVTKLRASDGGLVGTYAVGDHPGYVAFDGIHIWVTNMFDDTITKLRASDGGLVGTYAVGDHPYGMTFDGAYIWVANFVGDSLSKL